MSFAFLFLLAALVAWVMTRVVMTRAPKWGLMDHPGGRKTHAAPVPLVGGLGMFLACVAMIPFTDLPTHVIWAWLAGAGLIFGVGLADDVRDLSALPRFGVQVAAALVMALGAGLCLHDLGNLFGPGTFALGILAVPFTVFAVVGVMNAMNMSDGADGLAGGTALVALVWFAVAAGLSGEMRFLDELAVFGGAVAAFLALNLRSPWRQRAAVFMGDSGSLFLGFMLAWFAVALAESPEPAMPPMTAVWILALPIMDTLASMMRRMARGESPFRADREHLHHILMAAGYSDREAVAMLLLASTLFGAVGVSGWVLGVPEYVMFYGFLGVLAVHFTAVMHAWRMVRMISRWGHEPVPTTGGLARVSAGGAQVLPPAGPAVRARPRPSRVVSLKNKGLRGKRAALSEKRTGGADDPPRAARQSH